ncbi:MAG: phosphate ABC transporter permease PstA [Calditrichia bacterium]
MADRISYFRQKGVPYILLTGLTLILSLGMVILMVAIILVHGLGFFWPRDLVEVTLKNNEIYLGEPWAEGTITSEDDAGNKIEVEEFQIKKGNRDIYGSDFAWLVKADVVKKTFPENATTFERYEYGNFYGFIDALNVLDTTINASSPDFYKKVDQVHEEAVSNKDKIEDLESELNDLVAPLTRLQREISLLEINISSQSHEEKKHLEDLRKQAQELEEKITPEYQKLSEAMQKLKKVDQDLFVKVRTAEGRDVKIQLANVVRFYQPNRMSVPEKIGLYASKVWEFISADPRESNTEGGVFPAIFGTVMMVLLMSIAVVPFGVLAALYLNEYATQGTVIRLIRLSVNNLAGVPSIVFGIFGLGFFIYVVGGTMDQLFFSSKLPEPTFGTGGILWASLTLALLTLPVVVVATEEGILAVPRANKEGALALGATRWQMIRKIVLPNAMPGILTGLILAISRGAGEVAPLMITGVVKLAPSLPIDGTFPFLHLDRKFMHLGFHIYDVGFQSPNVEAAKPMVYSTALLLILIVVILNLLAIYLRNRLRKKYKTSVF